YPVNQSEDVEKQLSYAVGNEKKEGDEVYRTFGDVALQEGFNQIAGKFYMIADIEKVHASRFQEFLNLLKQGRLFAADVKTGWMCMNCGYIIEATNAPQNCPVCDADQGYFIRLSMAPYTVPEMDAKKQQDLGK
ncbi:MAG: rubrerythrin family protein, partial [Clostridiaceae bacterium]|nr:rubrerythrin family protein [Clostridiaceae bacterium]